MTVRGVSSGLSGINRQSAAMDRAAEKIARAASAASSPAAAALESARTYETPQTQLLDGTVEMMVATRMFTAALKMAQTANEGVLEALRVGGYEAAA